MVNGFMTGMKFSNVTDQSFWDAKYEGKRPRYSLNDPFYGKRGLLAKTLLPLLKDAKDVLEIGCGSSRFMMFFNMVAGLDTYGLDFSREGLHNLQIMSARHGVRHKLYFGDMFEHEAEGRKFDIVFHAGLVEHFSDLDLFFKRCRFFTKDNGMMIFTMPNMQNLAWRWHRRLCPVNFGAHIKYTEGEINREASRYFNMTLSRPWGYPQVYAGGPPESALAALFKFVNIAIILGLSFPLLGYKGSVGKRLASTWLFICRAK
jgi:ubiquinone/menaquinone biosynthesis C-methylase UbiE